MIDEDDMTTQPTDPAHPIVDRAFDALEIVTAVGVELFARGLSGLKRGLERTTELLEATGEHLEARLEDVDRHPVRQPPAPKGGKRKARAKTPPGAHTPVADAETGIRSDPGFDMMNRPGDPAE